MATIASLNDRVTKRLHLLLDLLKTRAEIFDFRLDYLKNTKDIDEMMLLEMEQNEIVTKLVVVLKNYVVQVEGLRTLNATLVPKCAETRASIVLFMEELEQEHDLQRKREESRRRRQKENAACMEKARNAMTLLNQCNQNYETTLPPWVPPTVGPGHLGVLKIQRTVGEIYIRPEAIQSIGPNHITFDVGKVYICSQSEGTSEPPSRNVRWYHDKGWHGIQITGIQMDSPEPCVACERSRKEERRNLIRNSKALRARKLHSE